MHGIFNSSYISTSGYQNSVYSLRSISNALFSSGAFPSPVRKLPVLPVMLGSALASLFSAFELSPTPPGERWCRNCPSSRASSVPDSQEAVNYMFAELK